LSAGQPIITTMEMPGDGFYGDVLFPLNDPGLQGDVLYAFMGGGLDLKGLQIPAAQRRLVQESHLVREGMHGSANRT
jgi:hypothetical protein